MNGTDPNSYSEHNLRTGIEDPPEGWPAPQDTNPDPYKEELKERPEREPCDLCRECGAYWLCVHKRAYLTDVDRAMTDILAARPRARSPP